MFADSPNFLSVLGCHLALIYCWSGPNHVNQAVRDLPNFRQQALNSWTHVIIALLCGQPRVKVYNPPAVFFTSDLKTLFSTCDLNITITVLAQEGFFFKTLT